MWGDPERLFAAALIGYLSGFTVIFVWTRRIQKSHGVANGLLATVPAAFGGALGGCLVLLFSLADAMNLLGL